MATSSAENTSPLPAVSMSTTSTKTGAWASLSTRAMPSPLASASTSVREWACDGTRRSGPSVWTSGFRWCPNCRTQTRGGCTCYWGRTYEAPGQVECVVADRIAVARRRIRVVAAVHGVGGTVGGGHSHRPLRADDPLRTHRRHPRRRNHHHGFPVRKRRGLDTHPNPVDACRPDLVDAVLARPARRSCAGAGPDGDSASGEG